MKLNNIKNYLLQLSKSRYFQGIAISIAIFRILPSWFCLIYSTLIGKIVLLLSAFMIGLKDITAGFFAFALLILIHERCHRLIVENFVLPGTQNNSDSSNSNVNMKPIESADDYRKRICVKSYKDFISYDASGNPNTTTNEIIYTVNPNIATNKDFFYNVAMPFYIGATFDKKNKNWTGKYNGKVIDKESVTKDNGCIVDPNTEPSYNATIPGIICNPKCNWQVIDSQNK